MKTRLSNYINNFSKTKKITILSIIAIVLVCIISGTSYAFFTMKVTNQTYVMQVGTLDIRFQKTNNAINLNNTYPMTNNEGLATAGYTFNVKNMGTIPGKYLVRLELDPDNEIPVEYIKVAYQKTQDEDETVTTPTLSEPVLLSNLTSSLIVLSDESIGVNKTDTINLKLWLDINAPNDTQNKSFKAKIVIDGGEDIPDSYYAKNTSPIINLNKDTTGNIHMNIVENSTFTDPGVESINDDTDTLSISNVTTTYEYYDGTDLSSVNAIDTSTTGIYYVVYSITDSNNNTGKAVRAVTVSTDTTSTPTISLNGNSTMTIDQYGTFTDPGVTVASGNHVVTIGEVKTSVVDTQIIKYIVIDQNGNMNSITRTIVILPPTSLSGRILANNTLRTETPDFTTTEPVITSYSAYFSGNPTSNNMTNYQERYITYASSYTVDNSGKISFTNPQVCQYQDCYELLERKYIVSPTGSTSNTPVTSTNLSTIYMVTSTTIDSLNTVPSKLNPQYDSSLSGLYSMNVTDGFGGTDGTTYYFRGKITNNYVSFASKTWRVVRINEDGTIRLILDGDTDGSNHRFNTNTNNYSYMYYSNSTAKTDVESWYSTTITGGNAEKVAVGNYFCEAAKTRVEDLHGYTPGNAIMTSYLSYVPDLKCETDGNTKGLLNNSVGLITYDELVMAGAYYYIKNTQHYLYKSSVFWAMSPAGFGGTAMVWSESDGIYYTSTGTSYYSSRRLRPVINLKADVVATGSGTSGNPYVIR